MSDSLREALTAALGAQYDVIRLLGRGGMGAVYLARERLLERLVAIKVLPHYGDDAGDARERFLREARTAARLMHPNIVPLFSFGTAGDTLFYIMGFVEGESLEQRLRREGRIPYADTRRILSELARALDHAHAQGIIHRDLKPDNVMIEAGTGRAVLTDFGIARRRAEGQTITQTGVVVGTPHYMSPEQATGERELDGRSDLYALGVMGYRMLAGRLPFDGSVQELIAQHVTRQPVPLSTVVPDAPHDLDAALTRCLAKSPEQRWSSAALLADALGSADEEGALPDELQKLPAMASSSAIVAYGSTMLGSAITFATNDTEWVKVFGFGGWFGTAFAMAVGLVRARKAGMSASRALRIMFYPPKSWDLWWPRPLRRNGDVWDQLPPVVRRARLAIQASLVTFIAIVTPLMAHLIIWARFNNPLATPGLVTTLLALIGLSGLGMVAGFAATIGWQKKFRLSSFDGDRLRAERTWGSRFWAKPEIARLLSGASVQKAPSAPDSAPALAQAVRDIAATLPSHIEPAAREAGEAAAAMVRAIDALEREMHELSAGADPAELARLRERVSMMGARRNDESQTTTQMRDLLLSQVELMQQLQDRAGQLASRRERYLEMLRMLWLQMTALRAGYASGEDSLQDVSGRIRQLCSSVADQVEAERIASEVIRIAPVSPARS